MKGKGSKRTWQAEIILEGCFMAAAPQGFNCSNKLKENSISLSTQFFHNKKEKGYLKDAKISSISISKYCTIGLSGLFK